MTPRLSHFTLAVALIAGIGLGLNRPALSAPPVQRTDDRGSAFEWTAAEPLVATQSAAAVYKARCSVCHGATGKGDGPGASALSPKPPNFRTKEWQSSLTDEQLKRVTLEGGPAIGKSPVMPAYRTLKDKPEVLNALVVLMRGMKD